MKNTDRFVGVDFDLSVSLLEYGRIYDNVNGLYWGVFPQYLEGPISPVDKAFFFSSMSYDDFLDIVNGSWFDIEDVLRFVDSDREAWLASFPQCLFDAVDFYGVDKIFGNVLSCTFEQLPGELKEVVNL